MHRKVLDLDALVPREAGLKPMCADVQPRAELWWVVGAISGGLEPGIGRLGWNSISGVNAEIRFRIGA